MKRAFFVVLAILVSVVTFAQSATDAKYGIGKVPVENGKVTFVREISFDSSAISAETALDNIGSWAKGRFAKPIVLAGRIRETQTGTIHINAEEYITFKQTALITDRSRINYNISISISGSTCTFKMTDIEYLYEEERDGGTRFTAEDWITDQEAFNRAGTKMLKTTGKFRVKTIDLVDQLEKDICKAIAGNN